MARISLTPPRTLLVRIGDWYSRRTHGSAAAAGAAVTVSTPQSPSARPGDRQRAAVAVTPPR
ncbi:hypothetical protein [Kitasatospora acidiphila]|uniref:hypothetical protein n=1 Tax=Kitasatospora acidiphila TaxID=2567942 RepID=UPI001E3A44F1|nr:hypothetical protein [Kitasatospora acidiphila]